jgi:hypothetical protein
MTIHQISKGATGWLAAAALFALPFTAAAEEETKSASSSVSIGTDPSQGKAVGATADGAPPVTIRSSKENWEFGFHGYLRAPLRMSFDKQNQYNYPVDENGVPILSGDPSSTTEDWRFHMTPALPDTVYTDWKYTNSLGGPWAEMVFSYGNSIAVGNVSVASYNITDSGWRNIQSQLGIDQAFVTLNFPRAFGTRGGLVWNVGVFANRYGSAGRYDAGRYDTYLFGRTHIAGETLTAKIDLTDKLVLILEHGFGAKTDVLTGNAQVALDEDQSATTQEVAWMPYAGAVGQWPAMVNHAHAGLVFHNFKLFKELQINGHFLHAFTNSADGSNDSGIWPYKEKDGKQIIGGGEIKFNGALWGDMYLGFSTMKTDGLDKMPDAIELLHSQGGWCLLKNFYGDQLLQDNNTTASTTRNNKANPGTGQINTLAWQYQLSLARLLWGLQDKDFWGQGPDLTVTTWGMLNFVNPDDKLESYLKRWAKKKMKVGAEAMYTPIKYFGFGLRMDRVMPDMDYNVGNPDFNQSSGNTSTYAPFTIISPKLQFRTAFVTHEEVNIQYSRYFWEKTGLTDEQYRNEVHAENPNEGTPADRNALMISVNMWW